MPKETLDSLNRKSSIADDITPDGSTPNQTVDSEIITGESTPRRGTELLKSEIVSNNEDFIMSKMDNSIYNLFFGKLK